MPGAKQTPSAEWGEVGSRHYKSVLCPVCKDQPSKSLESTSLRLAVLQLCLLLLFLHKSTCRGEVTGSEHFLGAAMRPACHRCSFASNLTSVDWSAWSVMVSIRFYSIGVELMPSHVVGKWLPVRCSPHRHPSDFKR